MSELTKAIDDAAAALVPFAMLSAALDNGRLLFGGGHLIPDDEVLMTGAQGEPQLYMRDLRRSATAHKALRAAMQSDTVSCENPVNRQTFATLPDKNTMGISHLLDLLK